jgi:hypothetical protein
VKVNEILSEHKKGIKAKKYNKKPKTYIEPKKAAKPKKAAYGPGPGGAYGVDAGYSGSGGEG